MPDSKGDPGMGKPFCEGFKSLDRIGLLAVNSHWRQLLFVQEVFNSRFSEDEMWLILS